MSKDAYRQKAEAKIEEHQAKLNAIRAKAKGATADARLDAEKRIGDLEEKLDAAKKRIADIGDAAEDTWEELTKSLDSAWDDIAGGIKNALARFK
jgi:chromosome segregation ATPase